MRSAGVAIASCVVATLAFAAYARTLLPGVDLGDTGGFQAAVLWPEISARQAYPLYYALAKPFVAAASPSTPARGLNLFSAICAAGAVGLLTGVVAAVSRSVAGGIVSGLLLAFSYTFWTQAVIAEVYTLHLALAGTCLVALAAYARKPGLDRLTLFFASYAVSFGNHLSMILLLLPFAVFLFLATPQPSMLVRPRVVALALVIAAIGALQYLPNLLAVWTSIDAPESWSERLAAFWFDATKADWRESMIGGVPGTEIPTRLAMFAFDARQQFGTAGTLLAAAGAIALWWTNRPWAALVLLAYAVNTVFALSYNVGDPHVFFLPAHYFGAFAAGCAVAAAFRRSRVVGTAACILALAYAGWRAVDTWPAADRHRDHRAEQLVQRLTFGVDDRSALLVTALNWQVENALLYESRYGDATGVAWTRLADVFLHFPLLVRDNHAADRDVVLTARAAAQVAEAFGPLLPALRDPVPPAPSLVSVVSRVPRGAPYVLAVLTPPRDELLDADMLAECVADLTGRAAVPLEGAPYEVLVGRVGEDTLLRRTSARPFRERIRLPEGTLEIRMDGWVPLETFRRGGFGHVTLDGARLMFIERGVSFVWLDHRGAAEPVYVAGLYAAQPRFRLARTVEPKLALLH